MLPLDPLRPDMVFRGYLQRILVPRVTILLASATDHELAGSDLLIMRRVFIVGQSDLSGINSECAQNDFQIGTGHSL